MLSDETPALLAARASLSPLCTSTWKDVERTDAVVVWQVADILSLRAHYRYEFDHLKFIDQNSSAVENRMRALIARRKGRWGLDCHVSVWRLEK
jgi:hypothetical protein